MTSKIHLPFILAAVPPHRIVGRALRRLACVLFLIPPSITACAQDIHQTARAVDEHYNHLRTLQTDFTEIYRGAGVERVESGTLWLKKPRKMRWEYRSPKEKLFISDGKAVWFYLPAERQLRKSAVRSLDDLRSPLAFLLGKTKLENELQGLSKVVDQTPLQAGDVLLRGAPKAMADRVSDVLLEITPANQIVRIVLTEVDGATTEFRFASSRENLDLSDNRFQFRPPPGVETVEGELGP
ncbi:MAG: outer membrane lipoprotein chaperone LolA [Terriglobales bacterium]